MTTPPGPLSEALTNLWDAIRGANPGLPPAHVTIVPARVSTDHGQDRWVMTDDGILSGLLVGTDTLQQGAEAVLTALLHEAAHVLCWRSGDSDTSVRGRYHNGTYLEAAESVGMTWEGGGPDAQTGYADPVPTPATLAAYRSRLTAMQPVIDGAIPFLVAPAARRKGSTKPARVPIACGCRPPRLARMSQTQLNRGPVLCGVCIQPFLPAE